MADQENPNTRWRRVAIVGSREYNDMPMVGWFVRGLPKGTVIISGGARGVDTTAARAAKQVGHELVVRNTEIVNDCDRLVAFWDGVSRGTADAIAKAHAARKPVEVYGNVPVGGPRRG